MNTKITCPVCDRPGVAESFCPNCETDLSLIRVLIDLPTAPPSVAVAEQKSPILPWLTLAAIAVLALGILLGGVGVYWPLHDKISQIQPTPTPTVSPLSPTPTPKPQPCNRGFEYIVRRGDSLSLIALRFYGDAEQQELIIQANPNLKGKEDFLDIGDQLLIPNLNSQCS